MDTVTKTFRADNMLVALQQVQEELGPDALVVSMRKIPGGPAWQVWRSPRVEIIAMKKVGRSRKKSRKKTIATPSPSSKRVSQSTGRRAYSEVRKGSAPEEIKPLVTKKKKSGEWRPYIPPRVIVKEAEGKIEYIEPEPDNLAEAVSVEPLPPIFPKELTSEPPSEFPRLLEEARDQLLSQGLENDFILQILATCLDILPSSAVDNRQRVRFLVQRQLEAEIQTAGKEDAFSLQPLFLLGSSGSYKKLACAQLAAFGKHSQSKKVVWICANTVRSGGITTARTFTELLDIPLLLSYTPGEFEKHVNQNSDADLLLVDTPDCNPRNEVEVVELGGFVTRSNIRSTYIVVSATTKEIDLMQTVAAFRPFRIKGMIVTRMNETLTFGNIYNVAQKSHIPLAYFSNGPHIFNDLKPAKAKDLVDTLFGEGFVR